MTFLGKMMKIRMLWNGLKSKHAGEVIPLRIVLGKNLPNRRTSQHQVRFHFTVVDLSDFALVPTSTPIPTLGPAVARLTQSLTALTTSHASNSISVTSMAEEHAKIDERETELREMVDKAERKRSWFVAFRDWVESVATFLDEKVRIHVYCHCNTYTDIPPVLTA
jgi:hypothetical protein